MHTGVKLSFVVASALLAITLATTPAAAGSLMPDPLLATITEARLNVSAALAYEPIAGLDLDALESEISERCTVALHQTEIEVEDTAEAHLHVFVTHAWEGEKRDKVALLTTVELYVPGEPAGSAADGLQPRRRSLRVWHDDYLELVATADAHDAILESVDSSLERLDWSLRTARSSIDAPLEEGGHAGNLTTRPAGSEHAGAREQSSDQFDLRLHADWSLVGRGEATEVEYHLVNGSDAAVCFSDGEDMFRGGRKMWSAPTHVQAHCDAAGGTVRPGETGIWRAQWQGLPCLAQVPAGFAESFPELVCGSTVPIRVAIRIFSSAGGQARGASVPIVSEPVLVRLTARSEAGH